MLDVMSGGRVVAGMLRGTSNEYVTYGVNPAESRQRFEEALELIVRAWTEPQPFGWQGRFYEYRAISIWPRPVQQPHPPIFMSGSSPEQGEFAARRRLGVGFAVTTVPLAREAARHYREQAHLAGWEPTPDHVLYRATVYVADTDQQALEDLESSGGADRRPSHSSNNKALAEAVAGTGYYGRDAARQRARVQVRELRERIELGQFLVGSPDTVLAQAAAIRRELGAGILEVSFPPLARDKVLRAIELFGTNVLPRMREL